MPLSLLDLVAAGAKAFSFSAAAARSGAKSDDLRNRRLPDSLARMLAAFGLWSPSRLSEDECQCAARSPASVRPAGADGAAHAPERVKQGVVLSMGVSDHPAGMRRTQARSVV